MAALLDNVFWHALTGAQRAFAIGGDAARRYAPGFAAIAAFAEPERPALGELAAHCAPAEALYCSGWTGAPTEGWQIDAESTMFSMVWDAAAPEPGAAPEAIVLGPEHAPAMLELAALTRPGPFGARNLALGRYLGVFDGARLVAMAGERAQAGRLREISAVCTHPDHQGRGLARRLMLALIGEQMGRGEQPFLHVMRDNAGARQLYERMGFRVHGEPRVRVISRR